MPEDAAKKEGRSSIGNAELSKNRFLTLQTKEGRPGGNLKGLEGEEVAGGQTVKPGWKQEKSVKVKNRKKERRSGFRRLDQT